MTRKKSPTLQHEKQVKSSGDGGTNVNEPTMNECLGKQDQTSTKPKQTTPNTARDSSRIMSDFV